METEITQKWEYLSQLMNAQADKHQEYLSGRFPGVKIAKYSPLALVAELNELGEQGWELVHMEPVAGSGRNADIYFLGGQSGSHSNVYFCVFKRPKHS